MIKPVLFLSVILLVMPAISASLPVIDHGPEDPSGNKDKTIVWRSGFNETNGSYFVFVDILSVNNDKIPDSNGGMLQIVGGELNRVRELNFEYDCSNPSSIDYECYSINGDNVFRWFNYVTGGDRDWLQLVIRVPKNTTSFIRVAEVGGMGCGDYYSESKLLGGYPHLE